MTPLLKRRKNGDLFPSFKTNLSDFFDIENIFSKPIFETLKLNNQFSHIPATNVKETDNEIIVELAVPGMNKKDFEIDIQNGFLEVKVEKEVEKKEEEENYTRREYNYKAFCRSFQLPDTVNEEKVNAVYDNGILKISLPKMEEAKKSAKKSVSVK